MVRFSFRKGLRFIEGAKIWVIERRLASHKLKFEDPEANPGPILTESEIYQRCINREWQIDESCLNEKNAPVFTTSPTNLRDLPEAQKKLIERKQSYLDGLGAKRPDGTFWIPSTPSTLAPMITAIAEKIEDKNPPSPATVFRWFRRIQRSRCATSLKDFRRNSGRKANPAVLSLFHEAVEEVYLNLQKLPKKQVVERLEEKVKRQNNGAGEKEKLALPGRSSVYRWLNSLYYEIVSIGRNGKAATKRELRIAMGGLKIAHILQRAEIDHTPVDTLLVCEITSLPLGRPWLTLIIDRMSRMILGFYVSFHNPSQYSVLYAVRMAIYPKERLLASYPDIKSDWPAMGVMDQIACDNGMEEHANSLKEVARDMSVELLFCPTAAPEMKAAIERLFGTVSRDLFHVLPGTVFSGADKRGDYPSESVAALTMSDFVHILTKWVVDVYHHTPHRGLKGRTPYQAWAEGKTKRILELPAYPQQFDTMIGFTASRTLFHYGIEYDNCRYNNPALQSIRARHGGNPVLQVRAYEDQIKFINVLDPDLNEYITVLNVDQDYAETMTRHTHRLACQRTRAIFGENWSNEELRRSKAEIQRLIRSLVDNKKMRSRKISAAVCMADSEEVFGTRDESQLRKAVTPKDLAEPKPTVKPFSDEELGSVELPIFKTTAKGPGKENE